MHKNLELVESKAVKAHSTSMIYCYSKVPSSKENNKTKRVKRRFYLNNLSESCIINISNYMLADNKIDELYRQIWGKHCNYGTAKK